MNQIFIDGLQIVSWIVALALIVSICYLGGKNYDLKESIACCNNTKCNGVYYDVVQRNCHDEYCERKKGFNVDACIYNATIGVE